MKDASLQALEAAKALVKDIEFFRAHGTADMNKRYSDHRSMDGYSWIVRRARKMTRAMAGFPLGGPKNPDASELLLPLVAPRAGDVLAKALIRQNFKDETPVTIVVSLGDIRRAKAFLDDLTDGFMHKSISRPKVEA